MIQKLFQGWIFGATLFLLLAIITFVDTDFAAEHFVLLTIIPLLSFVALGVGYQIVARRDYDSFPFPFAMSIAFKPFFQATVAFTVGILILLFINPAWIQAINAISIQALEVNRESLPTVDAQIDQIKNAGPVSFFIGNIFSILLASILAMVLFMISSSILTRK